MLLVASLLTTTVLGGAPAQVDQPVSDKEMTVIDFEDMGYPPLAGQTRTQGVVVVRAKLDNDGKVVEAAAISGHEFLIAACLANAKKWRFKPNPHRAAIIVYNFQMPPLMACKSNSMSSYSILQVPNFVTITACAPTVQP
jgi:TonB family protein